jgi:signal transduction histidine kinase
MVHELRPAFLLEYSGSPAPAPGPSLDQRQRVLQILHDRDRPADRDDQRFPDLAPGSGRTEFHAQTFDLTALLEECAGMMVAQAEANSIRLRLEISLDLPPLKADRDKIKQVILNLLSNAIKYNCQDGEVLLRAYADGKHFAIEVTDTGPGIRRSISPTCLKNSSGRTPPKVYPGNRAGAGDL